MSRRLTPLLFIEKAKKIHGDVFDYSKIDYVHSQEKVSIMCKIHGEFRQNPQKHLNGQGCPLCRFDKSASKQRFTDEQFIQTAHRIHKNKYDYTKVNYTNNHTKVVIICPVHGEFEMLPSNHTHGQKPQGCKICGGKKQWTETLFIENAQKTHKSKYDYSKVNYVSMTEKVKIICSIHGDFLQQPAKHLRGQGCPTCAGTKKKTTEQFIDNAKKIHGNKYIYDETIYKTNHEKVKINCPEHGYFEQSPANHTHNRKPQGCPKCSNKKIFNSDDFIKYANEKHNYHYSYKLTQYIDSKTPVKIICPYHGEFTQKPHVHLMGSGCSRCRSSKGENRIETVLKKFDIPYENQYSFPDCRYKSLLFFDFKISVGKTIALIEYNGEQHYRELDTKIFNFAEIQTRDKIKKQYCEEQDIPLLEISFDQYDSIEEKILLFIKNLVPEVTT